MEERMVRSAHQLYADIKSRPAKSWHPSHELFVRAYEQGWYKEEMVTPDVQKEKPNENLEGWFQAGKLPLLIPPSWFNEPDELVENQVENHK